MASHKRKKTGTGTLPSTPEASGGVHNVLSDKVARQLHVLLRAAGVIPSPEETAAAAEREADMQRNLQILAAAAVASQKQHDHALRQRKKEVKAVMAKQQAEADRLAAEHDIKKKLRHDLERREWVNTAQTEHMSTEKADREARTLEAVQKYGRAVAARLREKGIVPGIELTPSEADRVNASRRRQHLSDNLTPAQITEGIAYNFVVAKQGVGKVHDGSIRHRLIGYSHQWQPTDVRKDVFVAQVRGVPDRNSTDPVHNKYPFTAAIALDADGVVYAGAEGHIRSLDRVILGNGVSARSPFNVLINATGLTSPKADVHGEGYMSVFDHYADGFNQIYSSLTGEEFNPESARPSHE